MIWIIRIAYYAAIWGLSFYAGRTFGKWLNESDRKSRIEAYHRTNKIRRDMGAEALSPTHFSLWAHDVVMPGDEDGTIIEGEES